MCFCVSVTLYKLDTIFSIWSFVGSQKTILQLPIAPNHIRTMATHLQKLNLSFNKTPDSIMMSRLCLIRLIEQFCDMQNWQFTFALIKVHLNLRDTTNIP